MKIILPVLLLLILLGLGGVLFFSQIYKSQSTISPLTNRSLNSVAPQASPSASPIAFQELTIPYLRDREYKSQLGELERVNQSGNYTSYLTSYTSDGLKINGLLTQPTGEMPSGGWPAIIFIHGYIPPTQYQTLTRYVDHVNFLARNGFVVFKIDLRGHGDSDGQPGGAYYSEDYIIDALNARAALQSIDFVNPDKIGYWGHSMAGNVVMRTLAAKPEIPAVVIWAGAGYSYIDLNTFGIQDSSYQPAPNDTQRQRRRQQIRELYGDPKDGNPYWNLVAPTNYLTDIKGAIQLNHAVNDDVVSIEYSRNLNKLLDATSVVHELHEYPSGGHNISGASFNSAMENTVEFFKKNLK